MDGLVVVTEDNKWDMACAYCGQAFPVGAEVVETEDEDYFCDQACLELFLKQNAEPVYDPFEHIMGRKEVWFR